MQPKEADHLPFELYNCRTEGEVTALPKTRILELKPLSDDL